MTFRTCLRKVFKIYKNGLESKLDDELSRNESQIETYFDSVCISKGFMVLYAIDHSVLRVGPVKIYAQNCLQAPAE